MPHGTRFGLRALSVYGGQTHGFPMGWKAPLCSFSTTSLLSGLKSCSIAREDFAQLLFVPRSLVLRQAKLVPNFGRLHGVTQPHSFLRL